LPTLALIGFGGIDPLRPSYLRRICGWCCVTVIDSVGGVGGVKQSIERAGVSARIAGRSAAMKQVASPS
jgi:hypothetical protein